MSLVLNVELIGEYKKLTQATNGARKQLSGLQKTSQSISRKINGAFAAIGVGISFSFIKNQLEEASKAAVEDTKSQVLLAEALRNTMKATDSQIASVEKQISKFQLSASVADDELRPAYSKLAIATGDVEKANKLMAIALDTAAGTGKSLDSVVTAMSKALNGNEGALARLVPSVRGAKDPIAELARTFDGAAAAAAKTDPYQRMNIIFGELQEQIGMALLPYLKQFTAWLASPGGQQELQKIVKELVNIVTEGGKIIGWVIKYREEILPLTVAIGAFTTAVKLAAAAQGLMNLALANPTLLAIVATIGFITAAYLTLTGQIQAATRAQQEYNASVSGATYKGYTPAEAAVNEKYGIPSVNTPKTAPKPLPTPPVGPGAKGTQVINQNITINNPKQTGADIVKSIQKQGSNVGRGYLR